MSPGYDRRENPGFIVCNFPSPSALRLAPSGYPPCSRALRLVVRRTISSRLNDLRFGPRQPPKVSRESFDARPLFQKLRRACAPRHVEAGSSEQR